MRLFLSRLHNERGLEVLALLVSTWWVTEWMANNTPLRPTWCIFQAYSHQRLWPMLAVSLCLIGLVSRFWSLVILGLAMVVGVWLLQVGVL